MSAKKWREEQQRKMQILLKDTVYIDNVRAADLAMRDGRITKDRYLTVLYWNQRSAMRRYERNNERPCVRTNQG